MENTIQKIGKKTINIVSLVGKFSSFIFETLKCTNKPFYFKSLFEKIFSIGYLSLPVIGMTAIFTGAVLALQSYNGFARFNAESSIPIVVVLSITRELGPVLAGLMFSARVGSSISAKIGTMAVTEQLDALKMLSVDPRRYIILPYILSGILTLPILVLIADIIGVLGGYLTSVGYLGFSSSVYIKNTMEFLTFWDVASGIIKALVFGFLVTGISCFNGYFTTSGAEGVGRSVINSVVLSSIMILFVNYFITSILF